MKHNFLILMALVLILLTACVGESTQNPSSDPSTDYVDGVFWVPPDTDTEIKDFEDICVQTGGGLNSSETPSVTVIHSRAELDAYCTANREKLGLDFGGGDSANDHELSFMEASAIFTEDFFERKVMVLAVIWEPSCSISHHVASVSVSDNGVLTVKLERYVPEWCDDAEAQWHILVELDKSVEFDDGLVDIKLETVTYDKHMHATYFDNQSNAVSDPYVGYCGNTMTTVRWGGEECSFMGGDSVYVTDLLLNLNYDAAKVCKCPSEYTVDTEFHSGYELNLTEGFARCDKGQLQLTKEQVEKLKEIVYNQCVK